MSAFGAKLSNILIGKGWSQDQVSSAVSTLEKLGNSFCFPYSFAAQAKIDPVASQEILAFLYMEGFLNHYSIPKYKDHLFFDRAQLGFVNTFEELQDPEDFFPLDKNEVQIITAYKVSI